MEMEELKNISIWGNNRSESKNSLSLEEQRRYIYRKRGDMYYNQKLQRIRYSYR